MMREKLKVILKREGDKHKDIFGVERVDEFDGVSYRYGNSETPLCPSRSEVVYPKVGTNKSGEKKFVVNLGNETIQGVRIELCVRNDKCTFSELFPSGYSTKCIQKYIYKKLLALGEEDKTVVEEFRLPSCCSCFVTGPENAR
ncbi:protein spaetzle 5-like [Periplaneta americana]|uniref:protein spaetzle 5-like n=1 Tax=Periplaneta americana TaxID=6978 RepID=UPI0037E8F2E1